MLVKEKVLEAVSKVSKRKLEEVTLDSRFDQLGMDSLDLSVLLFEIEETFDISVPQEEMQDVVTIGDIVGRLEKRLGGEAAATGSSS